MMSGNESRNQQESSRPVLDDTDRAILDVLQKDASGSNADLAERVGLSPSACLSRSKRLREKGVIRQISAVLDEGRIGLAVMTFTYVTLSPHTRKTAEHFVQCVLDLHQVIECHNVTGNWDYLLKIVAPGIAEYRDFIMDTLLEIRGVEKIETQIVLNSEKVHTGLPLEQTAIAPRRITSD